MSLSLIAAVGKNLELGRKNQLIFHIKEDMAFFKATTSGHTVLMGRKTWESIGRPLPNRKNLVVSRDKTLVLPEGVELITDLATFLSQNAGSSEEIFVIGGAQLYAAALPKAKMLYLTEVDAAASDADAFFPQFNPAEFNKTILGSGSDSGLNYQFVKYERK